MKNFYTIWDKEIKFSIWIIFNIIDIFESLSCPEPYLNWLLQNCSSLVIIIVIVAIVYRAFTFYLALGSVENIEVLIFSQLSKQTVILRSFKIITCVSGGFGRRAQKISMRC